MRGDVSRSDRGADRQTIFPQCLYADSAYEYAEYMKPSEILNKIYCVLVHIEKIWYNKCRAFIIRTYITRHDSFALIDISLISHNKGANK